MVSVASCQYMSTTPRPADRWLCCCARARRLLARSRLGKFDALCVTSAVTGPIPNYNPRRRALWSTRGYHVQRGCRYQLRVRPADQCRAARRSGDRHCCRCMCGSPRRGAAPRAAQLRRDPLRCKEPEMPAPCRSADRGRHAGMDIRYVVTSLTEGSAEHIYEALVERLAFMGWRGSRQGSGSLGSSLV